MSNLLRELASGPAALPRNSEIVLFNALTAAQQQQVCPHKTPVEWMMNITLHCIIRKT